MRVFLWLATSLCVIGGSDPAVHGAPDGRGTPCTFCRNALRAALDDPAVSRGDRLSIEPYQGDDAYCLFRIAAGGGSSRGLGIVSHPGHTVYEVRLPDSSDHSAPDSTLGGRALYDGVMAFVRRQMPSWFQRDQTVALRLPVTGEFERLREGCLAFELTCQAKRTGVPLARGEVVVEITSGRLASWRLPVARPPHDDATLVGRERAQELARTRAAGLLDTDGAQLVQVTEGISEKGGATADEPTRWMLSFSFARADDAEHAQRAIDVATVEINAATGAVTYAEQSVLEPAALTWLTRSRMPVAERIDHRFSRRGLVADRWPVWLGTGEQLACVSTRVHHGGPWWHRATAIARCAASGGELRWLEPGWSDCHDIRHFAVLDDRPTVVYSDGGGGCHVLDVRTGHHAATINDEERYGYVGATDGKIAFAARRRHGDGMDIFVTEISEKTGGPALGMRIERMSGDEVLPVLSPDAKTVYFAHRPPSHAARRSDGWTIHCADATKRFDTNRPRLVAAGFGEIERLSMFPHGKRLLVTTEEGVELVQVADGKTTPLDLSDLRDPDTGKRLTPHDAAVSPDGTRIAFSGEAEDEDSQNGVRCLYTCRLDGTELQRVTPLVEKPIEPYLFPESGKDAYELAKVRWESWDARRRDASAKGEE